MDSKQTKRISVFHALALRISALTLAIWLLGMGCITLATAQNFYSRFQDAYIRQILPGSWHTQHYTGSLPGEAEDRILRSMAYDQDLQYLLYSYNDFPQLLRDVELEFRKASIVTTSDGSVLFRGGNYLFFPYYSAESWLSADWNTELAVEGFAYVDMNGEAMVELRTYISAQSIPSLTYLPWAYLRLTGYFEGNEFQPACVEHGYQKYADSITEYPLHYLDSQGRIEWVSVYEADVPDDQPLVTIYTTEPHAYLYEEGDPISCNGVEYESLLTLLETALAQDDYSLCDQDKLTAPIVDSHISYTAGDDTYKIATVITCNPVKMAFSALCYVYLVTLGLTLAGLWLVLRSIRWKLAEPLRHIAIGYQAGATKLPVYAYSPWKEPEIIARHASMQQQNLHNTQNENQQLRTALAYAQNAEDIRRQMVSAIAHELKTPLAVIHSYAEGLQSGIAADKRERYLEVILEESERMDAMVLEMLDLSRLEAGKVQLSADEFSLYGLTAHILEKLMPAAQAKDLSITFPANEQRTITADEARITQVITNLLTNAIKYSPTGGNIYILVEVCRDVITFSVENNCEPLSDEVLERAWDTFYRADSARSGTGTGLGLAIVKSIVQLHRGTCSARNTNRGVLFSFSLPL